MIQCNFEPRVNLLLLVLVQFHPLYPSAMSSDWPLWCKSKYNDVLFWFNQHRSRLEMSLVKIYILLMKMTQQLIEIWEMKPLAPIQGLYMMFLLIEFNLVWSIRHWKKRQKIQCNKQKQFSLGICRPWGWLE